MYLSSYVIYKGKLPTGCTSMSTSNYTIQTDDSIYEVWRQEKKKATGIYDTKNAGTN
jgi:hypothetical protein